MIVIPYLINTRMLIKVQLCFFDYLSSIQLLFAPQLGLKLQSSIFIVFIFIRQIETKHALSGVGYYTRWLLPFSDLALL